MKGEGRGDEGGGREEGGGKRGGKGGMGEGWWRQKNTFASEATPLQTLTC